MQSFKDKTQFEEVMAALFERLMATPTIAEPLVATGMVVRFRYPDLSSTITFDFAAEPPAIKFGDEGEAQVEMSQTSAVSHQFWLGRLNAVRAIATGKVRARGDIAKALKLLPAIKPAFAIYPGVLHDMDLGHMIPEAEAGRTERFNIRRFMRMVGGHIPLLGTVDRSRLPVDTRPQRGPAPVAAPQEQISQLPEDKNALRREMLGRMHLIRQFEEELARSWHASEVPTSAIHLSVGQEASAVGVCFALRHEDCIASTHRGHGHMLAKGAPTDLMMSEIFGKADGLCKGKGGSMHVTDARIGAIGANGIVGASPLLAMGAALAFLLQGRDLVSVAFLGDGATNQGMFHEAVNLAAVWRLPVLFVIENNQYGEFTAQSKSTRVETLSARAAAYGIRGVTVDGNDVDIVYESAVELVETLRAGNGPALLECLTYRWKGHMEGDAQSYRAAEEVAEWKARDPIGQLRDRLVEEGSLSQAEADVYAEAARKEVQAVRKAAGSSREPPPSSLADDVFAPDHVQTVEPPRGGAIETMTGSAAVNMALREEMERDEAVILLGEDVSFGGYLAVTAGLVEQFGEDRVRDTPISENAIVGGSVGAAMNGLRPVAEILFADFITTCMDPLVNQAAKLRYMSGGQYQVPMVVRTPCGVGLGMAAQHSQSLEAMLTGIPGLIVAAPGTPRSCRGLLKAAIRSNNPVLFFEHKLLYLSEGEVPLDEEVIPLGKAEVVRTGGDVTVVATLYMVQVALEAAEALAGEGVGVEVVDPRTLSPLDTDTILDSVTKTRRLVTLEEGPVRGGFGAEVVARVAAAAHGVLRAPPLRIGGADVPVPYNKNLETLSVPDVERLVSSIRALK